MKRKISIGGGVYFADTAAISCLRYRELYGSSVLYELLGEQSPTALHAKLTKMVWAMVQPCDTDFKEFAEACRDDKNFIETSLSLRAELLKPDPRYTPDDSAAPVAPEEFDDMDIVARLALAGLDFALMYELPIFYVISAVNRVFRLKSGKTQKGAWVKLRPEDVSTLLR